MRPSMLALLALLAPTAHAQPDLSELTALAESALVGQYVEIPVPGFEILVLRDGDPIYHRAFGAWTIGRVAACDSSTKTLSGAVMMSVVESTPGITLDTPLAAALPEFDVPLKRNITTRTAFSHTSGLPGGETSGILLEPDLTLREAATQIAMLPMQAPAGQEFNYGGVSMHAAGAFAEVVTATPFTTLLEQRLTAPMQMDQTRFVLASDTNPRIAGGAESTAEDFARFMDMLLNEGVDRPTGARILSAPSVRVMLTRQTNDAQPIVGSPTDNNRYGVGVWVDQLEQFGPPVAALAAGARGFHAWIDPSYGLVMVFATDRTRFSSIEELSSRMHAAVLEAVRCPADLTTTGSTAGFPDGLVDISDFSYFLSLWSAGALGADLTSTGGSSGTPDGIVDISDFSQYLGLWSAGCP